MNKCIKSCLHIIWCTAPSGGVTWERGFVLICDEGSGRLIMNIRTGKYKMYKNKNMIKKKAKWIKQNMESSKSLRSLEVRGGRALGHIPISVLAEEAIRLETALHVNSPLG